MLGKGKGVEEIFKTSPFFVPLSPQKNVAKVFHPPPSLSQVSEVREHRELLTFPMTPKFVMNLKSFFCHKGTHFIPLSL